MLDHALSPAFDVASPTSQGPSCPHKSDRDDRCSTWQRAHRRARQSAGAHRLAGALPHSELVARDVGKAAADRRYSESAMNPTKRPESEIQVFRTDCCPTCPVRA